MTGHAQVVHRGGAHFVGVLQALEADLGGELGDLLAEHGQRVDELGHLLIDALFHHQRTDQLAEFLERGAVVAQHLTAQQVQALDGVGAFVDHVDAGIAHELLHAPFLDVAVAAKHLLALGGGVVAVVGQEGLGDGREHREHLVAVLAHFFVRVVVCFFQQHRAVDGQCAAAFGVGLGGEQHAAHVGVHDDRIGRLVLGLGAGQAAHLDAVLGVGQRVLVSHFSQTQRLVAHAQAGGVHHDEHGLHALVGLTHQGADGAVDHDLRGGVAVDAHLVLQAATVDAIALAERAVGLDVEFRHDEQAHALDAGRRVGQAGQHQVDDVVGHVVFTGADEDLVAGDLVGAVGQRFGLGAHQAQVGAAVRLGQAHGAGPLAAGHLGQVGVFLRVGAVGVQRSVGAVREAGVHGPGLVGRVHHFIQALVDHQRQALAAVGRITAQRRPATFHVGLVGFLEAGRGLDLMGLAIELATLGVTADVQRKDHLAGELAGFFEHGIDGLDIHLGVLRHGLELGGHVEHFVHHELHVAQGRVVDGHGKTPVWGL
ncbi:hypothetical protein Y695_02500 [Hydrogenophaga sp. T4]|nr:hypothetical protein Y695_02500 [Hydrogenophaga sp. T4]